MSISNDERVYRARLALVAHMNETLEDEADVGLTDLLTDLMHLAAEDEVDFERALRTARIHFDEESGK